MSVQSFVESPFGKTGHFKKKKSFKSYTFCEKPHSKMYIIDSKQQMDILFKWCLPDLVQL